MSPLPPSPVKRDREDNEPRGSGTEPHKKKQKDEKKTVQDAASTPADLYRWKSTPTDSFLVWLIRFCPNMFYSG